MIGAGKYDALATHVREQANAEGVVVIVIGGEKGSGFSVQATMAAQLMVPDLLERTAFVMRGDLKRAIAALATEPEVPQ